MAVARHLLRGLRNIVDGGGVPLNTIAMWSGTLATIPANWTLCDGAGGTPNLIARFIKGAPAGVDPGATGGADTHGHASMTAAGSHTHTAQNQAHTHTVNSNGSHAHGTSSGTYSGANAAPGFAGSHNHTTSSSDHTHTMDTPANHTHGINANDGRPPYYELAFIRAGVGALIAANLIIIWTGTLATIPAGWSLCDGGGGRPDFRTRFIRGVNTNVTDPGTTGGAATHLHTEVNYTHSHTMNNDGTHLHTHSLYTWTHNHMVLVSQGAGGNIQNDTGAGNHQHANTDSIGSHNHNAMGNSSHSHIVNTASSLPTYYDVAYIINDGGAIAIPQNGVLIWTGLLANIPGGYNLCDGGGGRPDLRGRYVRGSAAGIDPGGTGGSNTHTHTDQNGGAHTDHTMVSAGAHQHAATDSIGGHTHAVIVGTYYTPSTAVYVYVDPSGTAGAHSHTYNNENNHTHTLTDPGNHVHNPWSTDNGEPAWYEVAYIMKA